MKSKFNNMKRSEFIQTLIIAPVAAFFGVKAIAKPNKTDRMKNLYIDKMNQARLEGGLFGPPDLLDKIIKMKKNGKTRIIAEMYKGKSWAIETKPLSEKELEKLIDGK